MRERDDYLTQQVLTCIGNKRALLPLLDEGFKRVAEVVGGRFAVGDLFCGSGVVSRYLKRYASYIHANDLQPYAAASAQCYLTNRSELDMTRLTRRAVALHVEALARPRRGFLSEMYAPRDDEDIQDGERVFYTTANAVYLDTARQLLEEEPEDVRRMLLGPLIAQASTRANTSGVFKGFHKEIGGRTQTSLSRITSRIGLVAPVLSRFEVRYAVTQADAVEVCNLVSSQLDAVYLDPPYNKHPYASNYFMLDLVTQYQRPHEVSEVSGIPLDWQRSPFNSQVHAEEALRQLIASARCRFVLLSYSSDGIVPHERILELLNARGRTEVLTADYGAYSGGRGETRQVKERLYVSDAGNSPHL